MSDTVANHAATRMQQCAIPLAAIERLLDYRTNTRVRGADSFFFDQVSRQRARCELGAATVRRFARFFDAYADVADDGAIITAAWRTRRLRRTEPTPLPSKGISQCKD